MVLLGVLEYLWLHNEYMNKYRDMETKLNHVMFSTVRDVEDSLLFSKIAANQFKTSGDSDKVITISIQADDSVAFQRQNPGEKTTGKEFYRRGPHHEMRGLLLRRLSGDSSIFDQPCSTMSNMVMGHIRMTDSTGEFAGYNLISWQGD
jgi:hypothetical protein